MPYLPSAVPPCTQELEARCVGELLLLLHLAEKAVENVFSLCLGPGFLRKGQRKEWDQLADVPAWQFKLNGAHCGL